MYLVHFKSRDLARLHKQGPHVVAHRTRPHVFVNRAFPAKRRIPRTLEGSLVRRGSAPRLPAPLGLRDIGVAEHDPVDARREGHLRLVRGDLSVLSADDARTKRNAHTTLAGDQYLRATFC